MSTEVQVREYKPGDEESIVSLLITVFRVWPSFDISCSPLEHWIWKYRDNPTGKMVANLSVVQDEVVGCFHSPLLYVKVGNSVILSSQGGDQAVHPDYRRMGLYTKMRELALESRRLAGVEFHFSGSGVQVMVEGSIKRGETRFPHKPVIYVRIRELGRHLEMMPTGRDLFYRYGFYGAKLLNRVSGLLSLRKGSSKMNVRVISRFDDSIDDIFYDVAEGYAFIVKRTKEYLNWRYCDSRGGNYRVTVIEEDGRVLGYCVVRINKVNIDYPVGWIVDIFVRDKRLDAMDQLVNDAVQYFDINNVNATMCLSCKGHPLTKPLGKHGYLDSRREPFIVYVPQDNNYEVKKFENSKVHEVHLVIGDFDWI